MIAGHLKSWEGRLRFGHELIPYSVRHSPRATLKITVHTDASVVVDAPDGRSTDEVRARVERRIRWIIRQRAYFASFLPRPAEKTYRNGETFWYLGRQYRLKAEKGPSAEAALKEKFLRVSVVGAVVPVSVRRAVLDWYMQRAREVFARRLGRCYDQVKRLEVRCPKLLVRPMKRRWGSLSAKGTIVLNRELIQAPIHCIDYVIVHELIHRRVPNHGPRFYQLLTQLMPDWKVGRARLERVSVTVE